MGGEGGGWVWADGQRMDRRADGRIGGGRRGGRRGMLHGRVSWTMMRDGRRGQMGQGRWADGWWM